MNGPYVICHMITSLDGRLLPQRWPCSMGAVTSVYERTAKILKAGGWIVGRRTMEEFIPAGDAALLVDPKEREDLKVIVPVTGNICVCFDRYGKLKPNSGNVDGDHLVIVLSNEVCDAHVELLRSSGVSVFFVGKADGAMRSVLARLADAFGIDRLLLEGGGELNAAFLAADLIDETSTLIFPVIDGEEGTPAIYNGSRGQTPRALEFVSAEPVENGVTWLRHKVRRI